MTNNLTKYTRLMNRREDGNVMVLTVLMIVIMLGSAGMVIDYGVAAVQEARLQKATDAAALAAVQDLPAIDTAKSRMVSYFTTNYAEHQRASATYSADSEFVWVEAQDPVPTYFMSLFGIDRLTVNAKSKAQLEMLDLSKGRGIMPFVLINPNKNSNPNDDLNPNDPLAVGRPYVLKYGEDTIMIDDWWLGEQTISHGNDHDGHGGLASAGWRSVLALDPDSTDPDVNANSADDFRTNFADGWDGFVTIGDILNSNPGVMTGAVTQGRRDRMSAIETDYSWEAFDEEFMAANPNHPRIVVVPIVSLGSYGVGNDGLQSWHQATENEILNESYDWTHSRVDGFAAFYLLDDHEQRALPGGNSLDRKWIAGRYLGAANIGGSTGNNVGGNGGGDFGLRIGRLIPY